jgi:FKBP-type peptidyl-prolyl cis-trans isomerase FklB
MNKTTRRMIQSACAGAVLAAFAPFLGAQAPTAQPAPSPSPGGGPAAAAPQPPALPPPLSNDQASYLFGLTFGEQLHGIGFTSELSADAMLRGLKDAGEGKKSTPQERQQIQEFVHSVMLAAAARNKAASQDFLTKNGHEKGVQTTASGLEYKVIKAGDAKAPPISATDEVTVNYRGKLIDGTEFDSSYSRGTPATFTPNGVIKGWQEALVMMKPGAVWDLYVPPELGYGSSPRPGIPANSALIFTVEVLSAKPKQAAEPPAPKNGTSPPDATAPKPQ